MKRVMCVDDSGCPELKFAEPYGAINGCPLCGEGGYILSEVSKVNEQYDGNPYWRCDDCKGFYEAKGWYLRQSYKKSRFIDIDEYADLLEVKEEAHAE